jgi:hypothetical protein
MNSFFFDGPPCEIFRKYIRQKKIKAANLWLPCRYYNGVGANLFPRNCLISLTTKLHGPTNLNSWKQAHYAGLVESDER